MKDPFEIEVTIGGQLRKLCEQLQGLTEDQAQELLGGFFSALRDAKKDGTVPNIDDFRLFLSGKMELIEADKTLICASPPVDLSASIGHGWKQWHGDIAGEGIDGQPDAEIRRLPKNINFAQVCYIPWGTINNHGISGDCVLTRLKDTTYVRLGTEHFAALWQDYHAEKDNSVLEWLRKKRGITFICFAGDVFRDPHGERMILSLVRKETTWHWRPWSLAHILSSELILRCAVIIHPN